MAVDLVRLGIQSGLNITKALEYVVRHFPGPLADEIDVALRATGNGQRLIDALDAVVDRLGDDVRPLVSVLVSGERYGAPLATSLAELARETRLDQERRAERNARRLSVQLLFPLAGFILPAFALLTAAPLLAGSIGTLASSFH
jgi:tight adherence protein C